MQTLELIKDNLDDPYWNSILHSHCSSLIGRVDLLKQQMIKCQLQLVGEIQSKSKEFFESRKYELMSAIKKQECANHIK